MTTSNFHGGANNNYTAVEIVNDEFYMQSPSSSPVSLTDPIYIPLHNLTTTYGPAMTAANLAGTWLISQCLANTKDAYTFTPTSSTGGTASLTTITYSNPGCTGAAGLNSVYSGTYSFDPADGVTFGPRPITFTNPIGVTWHGSDNWVTFWGSNHLGFANGVSNFVNDPYYTKQ